MLVPHVHKFLSTSASAVVVIALIEILKWNLMIINKPLGLPYCNCFILSGLLPDRYYKIMRIIFAVLFIVILTRHVLAENIADDNIAMMYSMDTPFVPKTCMDVCGAPYTKCAVDCTQLHAEAIAFRNDLVTINSDYQGYFLINEAPNQV